MFLRLCTDWCKVSQIYLAFHRFVEIGLKNKELCSPDDQGADGEDVEIGGTLFMQSHPCLSYYSLSLQQNRES